MADQICTIEGTRRRAAAAYHSGRSIADVGPNWNSAAYPVWKQVYAELDAQRRESKYYTPEQTT